MTSLTQEAIHVLADGEVVATFRATGGNPAVGSAAQEDNMTVTSIATDPHEAMSYVINALECSDDPDQPVTVAFSHALYGLIGLKMAEPAGSGSGPENEEQFRAALNLGLARRQRKFHAFQAQLCGNAMEADDDDYYYACLGRSALQILLDDYSDTGVVALIDAELLTETDTALDESARRLPPLHESEMPPGLPAAHWWWWLPSGEQESGPHAAEPCA